MALDGYVNKWEQEQQAAGTLFGDYGHMIESGANQYLVQKTSPIAVLQQLGTNGQVPLPASEQAKQAPGAGIIPTIAKGIGTGVGEGFKSLLIILLNTLTAILLWVFPPGEKVAKPTTGIVSSQ
jgi:hypothetical protein